MKTLRSIKFTPALNVASRYWEEKGFRRNDTITLADLNPTNQGIVAAALAWCSTQLPEGITILESVFLEKNADVATSWSTPEEGENPEPLTFSPSFSAAVTGTGELGEQTVSIRSSPGEIAEGLNVIWQTLAA